MSTATDYADFGAPQAHADRISKTGVPLLSLPSGVLNTTQSIAGGGQFSSANLSMTQTGYEFSIRMFTGAAATVPFVLLRLDWTDSGTSNFIGSDVYYVPASGNLKSYVLLGRGPCKANLLAVTIVNGDPAVTATATIVVVTNSRLYQKDVITGWNINNFQCSIPGFTLPSFADDNTVLGFLSSQSIGFGTNKQWLFTGAPGRLVQFSGLTSGITPASIALQVQATYPPQLTGGAICLHQTLTAVDFDFQFTAPNAPLLLTVFNNAGAGTLSFNGMMVSGY